MNIVIVGHIDHGKSTIIGRLLADTGSLMEGKLEQIKSYCARHAKDFEYAFVLDSLKGERSQGITINASRIAFKSEKRKYLIIDAPGHSTFLKNMVSGASHAEAALLVIDAGEGIQENSLRHAHILSILGIKQVAVVINKMDLVDYSEDVYNSIRDEYTAFLEKLNLFPMYFIPVSGKCGDNIAESSTNLGWYHGLTILEALDSFETRDDYARAPLRMPVQDIYKFTRLNNKRIIAGRIETGELSVGEEVVFYPSKNRSCIKTIEGFNETPKTKVSAGCSTGITLDKQIYVSRGEIMTTANVQPLHVSSELKVVLIWMGKEDCQKNKEYILKLGATSVPCQLGRVDKVINTSDLSVDNKDYVGCYEVAECSLLLDKPIAHDIIDEFTVTSRFVLVDQYDISGGGVIMQGKG